MRILVLTNLYPPHYLGGYELICLHVVNALRSRGHQISVLTSNHRVKHASNDPEEPAVDRSLRVHGFYGHPWLGISQLRHLESHNNSILRQAVQQAQPNLVYVWNMGGLSKSMLLTLQKLNIPVVFYLSDHWISRGLTSDVWLRWWNRPDAPLHHRIARSLVQSIGLRKRLHSAAPTNPQHHLQFQRIYFCSAALRDSTTRAGFNVAHGAVIHCPVNIEHFHGQPKPADLPLRKLLYVGRLSPDKGVMTALRAMELIRGQFPGQLHLFGHGDPAYVEELSRFTQEHQLPVQFKSASPAQMPSVYREHDALIFPSEWEEPFAQTPLEAMASGLPVIGTPTGGSAELFRHNQNALTYAPGNAAELAARILQLSNDPRHRTRIATAGFCEVRQRFAEPIIVNQIEQFLLDSVSQWQPVVLPDYAA